MSPLIWPILLLLLAVAFIFLELFIPSGGVLSFLAFASALAAVVLGFVHGGPVAGTAFLAVTVVVLPVIIALAIRWWPYTPFGRLIINLPPDSEDDVLPHGAATEHLKSLVGKLGWTETVMLPAGAIVIEGRTYDAVSAGMPIEMGQSVEVTQVEGNRIVVRPAEASSLDRTGAPHQDNILSRPLDSLGLDELDEPLT